MPHTILRLRAVIARTGIGRSNIYNKTNPASPYYDPTFPKSISLGARAIGFVDSEIEAWIGQRAESRNAQYAAIQLEHGRTARIKERAAESGSRKRVRRRSESSAQTAKPQTGQRP
jgi:prophage regulatory protein